jgi:hypothetical protein
MYRVLYPMRTYLIVSGRINEEANVTIITATAL